MEDTLPLQVLGQLTDLVDQPASRQVRVIGQRLAAERYLLEHGVPITTLSCTGKFGNVLV